MMPNEWVDPSLKSPSKMSDKLNKSSDKNENILNTSSYSKLGSRRLTQVPQVKNNSRNL